MNDWLRTALFLPPQASTLAPEIDHLHFFVILTTFAGAAFVGLLGVYYVIRYRHPGTNQTVPPLRHSVTQPAWLEGGIAGSLFALFLAWWLIGFMQYMKIRVAPEDTYDIYVTAKQWMWKFAYPTGQSSISELYVPVGRPVKLIMTSRDVIHSFFVPEFRLKQDVIPGRYTTLWFTARAPGKHQVFCAEYCGTNHSVMRAEVIALDPPDFARWLASGPRDESAPAPYYEKPEVSLNLGPSRKMSLERLGQEVAAQQGCLRCHTLDGTPHIGPTWAGLYLTQIPLSDGKTIVADEAYLTESMMDPLAKIHAGFQPVMPSYLGRLRPAETAAIVELIKSLKDVPGQPGLPGTRIDVPPTAGGLGQPPNQVELPLLQPTPLGVHAPPPSQQGLPPPGAPLMPPLQGTVEVGPNGQRGAQP